MTSHPTQPVSIQACVLHDATGRIVHIHRVATFPGATSSTEAQVEARCRQVATQLGHDMKDLRSLHVPAGELKPGTGYKVDVQKRRLVEQPHPSRATLFRAKK